MERQQAKAVLEAILFTMGESVEVERLAGVIEEDKKATKDEVENALKVLTNAKAGLEKKNGEAGSRF